MYVWLEHELLVILVENLLQPGKKFPLGIQLKLEVWCPEVRLSVVGELVVTSWKLASGRGIPSRVESPVGSGIVISSDNLSEEKGPNITCNWTRIWRTSISIRKRDSSCFCSSFNYTLVYPSELSQLRSVDARYNLKIPDMPLSVLWKV